MDAFLFRTGAHDLSGARIAGLEHHVCLHGLPFYCSPKNQK